MGKRIIKESEIKDSIFATVRRYMTESSEEGLYQRWLNLQKRLGSEAVLQNVWRQLDTDTIEKIINSMEGNGDGTA